jgi:hypothetical protein
VVRRWAIDYVSDEPHEGHDASRGACVCLEFSRLRGTRLPDCLTAMCLLDCLDNLEAEEHAAEMESPCATAAKQEWLFLTLS